MTVQELRAILRKMPANALVVLASDAEQSDMGHLAEVQLGYWDQYDGYGEFHEQDAATDTDVEWEPQESSALAVCFTPEER